MTDSKYDVVALVEFIESKPCLWDKTCEDNKNKIVRDRSWQEVFEYMEDGYTEMSQQEKKITGDMIMKKWTNVRDAFMRSLRCGTGKAAKKKYMYSDHLQFLLKTGKKAETVSNFNEYAPDPDNEDSNVTEVGEQRDDDLPVNLTEQETSAASTLASEEVVSNNLKINRKRQVDPIEQEILKELQSYKTPKLTTAPSDHEMILSSFLPHIRDLTTSELLDFQIQTLALIKAIKKQRFSNLAYQYHSTPSPSASSTPWSAHFMDLQRPAQAADGQQGNQRESRNTNTIHRN